MLQRDFKKRQRSLRRWVDLALDAHLQAENWTTLLLCCTRWSGLLTLQGRLPAATPRGTKSGREPMKMRGRRTNKSEQKKRYSPCSAESLPRRCPFEGASRAACPTRSDISKQWKPRRGRLDLALDVLENGLDQLDQGQQVDPAPRAE